MREHRLERRTTEILDFESQVGRLPRVTLAVLLTFALAPQLQVVPFPSEVGEPAEVRLRRQGQPVANATVHAEQPDGSTIVVGTTNDAGSVVFVPSLPGDYVITTRQDAVRVVVPHRVASTQARWPLAFGCVPLGLAALWQLRRERGRRGS